MRVDIMGIFKKTAKEKKIERIENTFIDSMWKLIQKDKKNEKDIRYIG